MTEHNKNVFIKNTMSEKKTLCLINLDGILNVIIRLNIYAEVRKAGMSVCTRG